MMKTEKTLPQARLRLLTLAECAEALGLSMATLRRRIKAGALPVIRDEGSIRVHPKDLDAYIAARRGFCPSMTTKDQS